MGKVKIVKSFNSFIDSPTHRYMIKYTLHLFYFSCPTFLASILMTVTAFYVIPFVFVFNT